MCRRGGQVGSCSHAQPCLIFGLGNFSEQNQILRDGKADFSQIYPQKLWATTRSRRPPRALGVLGVIGPGPAEFLRTEKYSLEIKVLGATGRACAHFYPQKVCRTLLAAIRATRYIAQLPCFIVFYLSRSPICSPFFKPPAGPSGCC
jgi:hypothetical protein